MLTNRGRRPEEATVIGDGGGAGRDDPGPAEGSLLGALSDDIRRDVISAASPVALRAGDWLFRRGDPADALFVVRSGRIEVLHEEEGSSTELIRVLGPGSALGEIGLLTGRPRSASVRARRDSVLLRLEAAVFHSVVRRNPALALELTRALGRMLAQAGTARLRAPLVRVVALTPLTSGVPMALLQEEVLRALGRLPAGGRSIVVSSDHARTEAASRGLEESASLGDVVDAYARLLDSWERRHDTVFLLTDVMGVGEAQEQAWTEFCLRSADRSVLVVGPGQTAQAARLAIERTTSQIPARPDVCFVDAHQPGRLTAWLDALTPRAHHQVRTHAPQAAAESVDRMVRRVLGCAVGVVLSGGGARGFAHLGVLATLRSAGIAIDRIGGCSIGSVMGALFAAGHSDDELLAICRRYFLGSKPLNDYTVPRTALLRGTKLRGLLQQALGPQLIESLPIPYFCVSADLITAETLVHRRGAVWSAVLASISIPGLLPPVAVDGRLLVDGGVLDNLPIDVMADEEEGPIIAVDVMRPFGRGGPSGRSRRRLPPWVNRRGAAAAGDELPPIAEVLARSTVLGSWRTAEQNRARAALTITVPDDGAGLLAWERMDALVQIGRRAAEAALADGPPGLVGRPAADPRPEPSGGGGVPGHATDVLLPDKRLR
jgi:NTE family protein